MEVFKKIIILCGLTLSLNCNCHDDLCGSGKYKCNYMFSTEEYGSPIKYDYRNHYTLFENGELIVFSDYFKDITQYSLSNLCENLTINDIAYYNNWLITRNHHSPDIDDTLTEEDYFIIVLTPTKAFKFDVEYNLLYGFGDSGSDNDRLINAVSIDIDLHGNSYIVDKTNSSVKTYDVNGLFRSKWSVTGIPTFIKIFDDNVYVLDKMTDTIKKYNFDGNFLGTILDGHSFNDVIAFSFESNNLLWVADLTGQRISQIDMQGTIKETKYDYCFNDITFQFIKIVSIDADVLLFFATDYESKYVLSFTTGPVD